MTVLAERRGPRAAAVPPAAAVLPSLTGMRWAAALLVFLYHVKNASYFGGTPQRFVDWAFGRGYVGVSFFFILSGFVLVWSARDGDGPVLFWRRRLARVYPVHLVTGLAALALGVTLVPRLMPRTVTEGLANLLLVSAWKLSWWQTLNPVSWSLTCEAFFYAVFPALYAGLRRIGPRGLAAVVVASALLVVLLPWVNQAYALGWPLISLPLARLPEFVLGAAAARLVRLGVWRGPGMEVSLVLTLAGYFLTRELPSVYAYSACTIVGLGTLIPAAAVADLSGAPSVWRHRPLIRLGEWSYAFYMVHVLVIIVGERLFASHPHLTTLPGLAAAGTAFAAALAAAWALYRLVERPGRRLILTGRVRKPVRPADQR